MNKEDFILEVCNGVETCVTGKIASLYQKHRVFSQDKINCHIYTKNEIKGDNFHHCQSYNSLDFSFSRVDKSIIKADQASDLKRIMKEFPYVSFLYCTNEKLLYRTDYWGIFPYFYYQDDQRFIITNNIFHIAKLLNKEQDHEAFYEILFFNSTRGGKTFFKDISMFLPNQALVYDFKQGKTTISETNSYEEIFNLEGSLSIKAAYEKFFEKAKNLVTNAAISLSSGSDSRTVLSCLMKYNMNPQIYNWGDESYVERLKVIKLAKNTKLDINYITFDSFNENFDQELQDGLSLSNGLLGSIHHMYIYPRIPNTVTLFEGFLGSEFIKAILSEGMVSYPYQAIIAKNLTLSQSMDKYFGDLDPDFKKNMEKYISEKFGHEFFDFNNQDNYQKFLHFAYSFIPAKKMSGMCMVAKHLGIYHYLTYLDIEILRATFSSGFGIANYCNIKKNYPGAIAGYKPEAVILREMNPLLYRSELGDNIRLIEAMEYPEKVALYLKKLRCFRDKYIYKNCFPGQVDHQKYNRHVTDSVNKLGLYKEVVSTQTEFKYPFIMNFLYAKYIMMQIKDKKID